MIKKYVSIRDTDTGNVILIDFFADKLQCVDLQHCAVISITLLTGQQPVIFLQFEAVQNPLDVLQLLLLLLLQLLLQGRAAFLLLLLLIHRLHCKRIALESLPDSCFQHVVHVQTIATLRASTYDLRVLLDGSDLNLELVDLSLVSRVWNCQVVHGEGPKGGVELRPQVVPDAGRVEGHHSLVHWSHHLFARSHVLVHLLLLLVAFLRFLQLVVF